MLDLKKRMEFQGTGVGVQLIDRGLPGELIFAWRTDGHLCVGVFDDGGAPGRGATHRRIVNAPEKRTVKFWLNVYPDGTHAMHASGELANNYAAGLNRIACLEFTREYTEGEGL